MTVLFDIGGVLTRQDFGAFTGVLRAEVDAVSWAAWLLRAPPARAFECGAISPDDFATAVAAELAQVDPTAVLHAFDAWVVGPFDGAIALVDEVRASGARAGCLSNCNAVHAPRLAAMGLFERFDPCLLSHELGVAKPHAEVFALATERAPGEILFLDDNPANVDAARSAGWAAECVRGPNEARVALVRAGVLRD